MTSAAPGATQRTAYIHLDNKTGAFFKFTVRHQYTGWSEDRRSDVFFKPNDYQEMMSVNYNTGFGTTGVDNWIVEGVKLEGKAFWRILKDSEGPWKISEKDGDYVEVAHFRSGSGALANWKTHSLRAEDERAITTIRVFPTEVHFISQSGTSTTSFKKM